VSTGEYLAMLASLGATLTALFTFFYFLNVSPETDEFVMTQEGLELLAGSPAANLTPIVVCYSTKLVG
jgi:hypothetical protein